MEARCQRYARANGGGVLGAPGPQPCRDRLLGRRDRRGNVACVRLGPSQHHVRVEPLQLGPEGPPRDRGQSAAAEWLIPASINALRYGSQLFRAAAAPLFSVRRRLSTGAHGTIARPLSRGSRLDLGPGCGQLGPGARGPGGRGEPSDQGQDQGRRQSRPAPDAPAPPPEASQRPDRPRRDWPAVQEPTQISRERRGVGVPPPRVLLQAFQRDLLEVARDVRPQPAGRHRLGGNDQLHRLDRGGTQERRTAG